MHVLRLPLIAYDSQQPRGRREDLQLQEEMHLTGIGAMPWQSLRLHKASSKLFLYHAAPPGGLLLCSVQLVSFHNRWPIGKPFSG